MTGARAATGRIVRVLLAWVTVRLVGRKSIFLAVLNRRGLFVVTRTRKTATLSTLSSHITLFIAYAIVCIDDLRGRIYVDNVVIALR